MLNSIMGGKKPLSYFLAYVSLCFVKCVRISVTTVCTYCMCSLLFSLIDHYLKITFHYNKCLYAQHFSWLHRMLTCCYACDFFVGQVTFLNSFFFLLLAIQQLMLHTNSLVFHLFPKTIKLPPLLRFSFIYSSTSIFSVPALCLELFWYWEFSGGQDRSLHTWNLHSGGQGIQKINTNRFSCSDKKQGKK